MRYLVEIFYSLVALPAIWIGMRLLGLWNPKMQRRLASERQALDLLASTPKLHPRIHFHAASMGELEQCVTVIEHLTNSGIALEFTVSSSSPSGYEHALRLNHITAAAYLPLDTVRSAERFLSAARSDVIVIDRYDLWPHFIKGASDRGIPIHVINATMPSAGRSLLLRSWVRATYARVRSITAVSTHDATQLSELMRREIQWKPDTRRDRVVLQKKNIGDQFDHLKRSGITTIVAGSTWPPDEDLLITALRELNDPTIRVIIVPHEPTEAAISRIQGRLPSTRLSQSTSETVGHIIVDSIGKLLALYSLADAAVVGGGHGVGVHSVTEPAGYFIPIACGPRIERSNDASVLQLGLALTVVMNAKDLTEWILDVVLNTTIREIVDGELRTFILANTGASDDYTEMILRDIT